MRSRWFLPLSLAMVSAAYACVGDDPVTSPVPSTTNEAGGGLDGNSSIDATDAFMPHDDGSTTDASDATQDGTDSVGPPAWTSPLPPGTTSVLANAGDTLCSFEVVSVQTATAPPQWEMYLRKKDAPAAICNEPKGSRALGTGYSSPTASLLKPQGGKYLVLAYSSKLSLSGSSPNLLRMSQVDWATGNDLHVALTKTKAVVGMPVTPSLDVTLLFFGDPTEEMVGTVRLKGTGSFPGETGSGAYFYATYVGFIGTGPQPGAAADTCTRAD